MENLKPLSVSLDGFFLKQIVYKNQNPLSFFHQFLLSSVSCRMTVLIVASEGLRKLYNKNRRSGQFNG